MADSENWIKQRAYELWEAEGQPHGKHHEHWEQASAEYEARAKSNGKAPAKRKTAPKPAALDAKTSQSEPVTGKKPKSAKTAAKSSEAKREELTAEQPKPATAKAPAKSSPAKAASAKSAAEVPAPKRARKSQPA